MNMAGGRGLRPWNPSDSQTPEHGDQSRWCRFRAMFFAVFLNQDSETLFRSREAGKDTSTRSGFNAAARALERVGADD